MGNGRWMHDCCFRTHGAVGCIIAMTRTYLCRGRGMKLSYMHACGACLHQPMHVKDNCVRAPAHHFTPALARRCPRWPASSWGSPAPPSCGPTPWRDTTLLLPPSCSTTWSERVIQRLYVSLSSGTSAPFLGCTLLHAAACKRAIGHVRCACNDMHRPTQQFHPQNKHCIHGSTCMRLLLLSHSPVRSASCNAAPQSLLPRPSQVPWQRGQCGVLCVREGLRLRPLRGRVPGLHQQDHHPAPGGALGAACRRRSPQGPP